MTRKIVETGSSLAVTLPREVVDRFKLKKGDEVEILAPVRQGVQEARRVRLCSTSQEIGALTIWFRQRIRSGE